MVNHPSHVFFPDPAVRAPKPDIAVGVFIRQGEHDEPREAIGTQEPEGCHWASHAKHVLPQYSTRSDIPERLSQQQDYVSQMLTSLPGLASLTMGTEPR